MKQDAVGEQSETLTPWDPARQLRRLDPITVKLSRGFLRCRPEKWFPAIAAHWLPLGHSLGVELRLVEAKPAVAAPQGLPCGFVGRVDDEAITLSTDLESTRVLTDSVCPGASQTAREVVLNYLARRLLGSLAMSWSGPESSVVVFDAEGDASSVVHAGAIKVSGSINGNGFSVWLGLGKILVDRLDGLWRRQVQSTNRSPERGAEIHLEVAQLAVPPSMLVEYLRSGTVVDLEVVMSDQASIRLGTKPWLPVRLLQVEGNFGFEVLPGPAVTPSIPEGTSRLIIELGSFGCEPGSLAELSQVGAMYATSLKLSNLANLVINGERVGEAQLCSYEGRFAITVR